MQQRKHKIFKKVLQIIGIIAAILLLIVFVLMRFIAPNFFKTEAEQIAIITSAGQQPPTFHTYNTGRHRIHYTHVGDTTKPLVLFVHGSPGSSDSYLKFLADTTLSRFCQMVSVDRAGFGESNLGVAEPILEQQAASLMPIIDRYGKGKKVILVGHSLGGPVIARMAMDFPKKIDALVIIAGSIAPELEPNEWFRPALKVPPFRWFLNKAFIASNDEIMPLKHELTLMLPLWEKIEIPVTVIQGTKDTFVPKENADFAKKMLVNCPKLDIQMIEGENHFVIWSQPELTKQAVLKYLTKSILK